MTDKTWGEEADDIGREKSAEREFQKWQRELALESAARNPLEFETWGEFFDAAIGTEELPELDLYRRQAKERPDWDYVWVITHGYKPGNGPEFGILHIFGDEEHGKKYVEDVMETVEEQYPTADIDRSIGNWEVWMSGELVRWFHLTPYRVFNRQYVWPPENTNPVNWNAYEVNY